MPRGRKAKGALSSHAQSTLSFNHQSARVTKSSARQDEAAKKAASKLAEAVQPDVEDEVEGEPEEAASTEPADVRVAPEPEVEATEIEVAIRESPSQRPKTREKVAAAKNERELAADKVTDAQLKRYWKAEEDSRLAPRVHQSSLSLHEKILRHFDLSSQYGPCIGIARLQRWKRANLLGLEPPVEVLAVLLREEDKKTSQGCGRLAYIDELAGGKVVLVE